MYLLLSIQELSDQFPSVNNPAIASDLEVKKPTKRVADDIVSNSCGNGAYYSFYSDSGTLFISGGGSMSDFSSNNSPWFSFYLLHCNQ